MTAGPEWIGKPTLLAIHSKLMADHGGIDGIRDAGLIDSALASPINRHGYGETDICRLAAAYAFAISRNHPFLDGNKRVAFTVATTFLELNGRQLTASEPEAVVATMALATGSMDDHAFGEWLSSNSKPR